MRCLPKRNHVCTTWMRSKWNVGHPGVKSVKPFPFVRQFTAGQLGLVHVLDVHFSCLFYFQFFLLCRPWVSQVFTPSKSQKFSRSWKWEHNFWHAFNHRYSEHSTFLILIVVAIFYVTGNCMKYMTIFEEVSSHIYKLIVMLCWYRVVSNLRLKSQSYRDS